MATKKQKLVPKKARRIDVQVLDVFYPYQPRIVVELLSDSARLLNSETGRLSKIKLSALQEAERCGTKNADATIRCIVRDMPKLALKWGLATQETNGK